MKWKLSYDSEYLRSYKNQNKQTSSAITKTDKCSTTNIENQCFLCSEEVEVGKKKKKNERKRSEMIRNHVNM